MLIMFRVKNFTSFHNEVILDMRATSYKEHPTHIIPFRDFRLLKTVAIYGANASGKSNLISALYSFKHYMFNHLFEEKSENSQIKDSDEKRGAIAIESFLLSDPVDNCIEFEIIFEHNSILYQYGFSFEKSKILTEWLYIDNALVFDRKDTLDIEYGGKYKALLKDYKKYREDRLYLSVLDYFATDKVKELIDNFKDFFQSKLNIYFEIFFESSIKGTMSTVGFSNRLVENEDFRKKVAEYIKHIDTGIIDLIIENEVKTINRSGEKKEMPVIKTLHSVYNMNGDNVKTRLFDLHQESTGTLRFFSFIQNVLILLENGGVFIIDELSARLHPLLTKFILDIFQSEINNKNAQLIFTTHDTSILNKEQLRRDEILFIEKNVKGESALFSLADLKTIRQDATYNKDYFNGKYGAIPIILSTLESNGGDKDGEIKSIH
jgi:uncharacterized protein